MEQKNLHTKMLKDAYKQQVSDSAKEWDIELKITKVLVFLWTIFMIYLFGYFIYLYLT